MELIYRKIKHARIEIKPDGKIVVVAPPNTDINKILEKNKKWIEKKLKELEKINKEIEGKENMLLLNGKFYKLENGSRKIKIEDSTIHFDGDYKKLKKWLKNKFRREIEEKVKLFSFILGTKYKKIYIRMQKTKWASCSSSGNLSFNLALLALPEEIRDYVIIHEIAHLIEPKHTKRFWKIVEKYCTDYKNARKELSKYWIYLERNNVWRKLREIK